MQPGCLANSLTGTAVKPRGCLSSHARARACHGNLLCKRRLHGGFSQVSEDPTGVALPGSFNLRQSAEILRLHVTWQACLHCIAISNANAVTNYLSRVTPGMYLTDREAGWLIVVSSNKRSSPGSNTGA